MGQIIYSKSGKPKAEEMVESEVTTGSAINKKKNNTPIMEVRGEMKGHFPSTFYTVNP